jgi:delta-lactam-biosynthetic de-N-acetylase
MLTLSSCTETDRDGNLIWHGDTSSNKIYLTFDDGPHPEYTPKVLDILNEHDVKATFFLVGERAKRHPEIVRKIHDEGHVIGNHSFSHSDGYDIKEDSVYREIKLTDDIIRKITGIPSRYFRPPFGFFNYRYFEIAEKLGYKTVLWTFDAADWGNVSAEELEDKIISKTKGGSIILLHDGGENREELIEALPNLIIKLKEMGFEFKELSGSC